MKVGITLSLGEFPFSLAATYCNGNGLIPVKKHEGMNNNSDGLHLGSGGTSFQKYKMLH